MVAFGFGEDDRDHLESAVCTLPLTLGRQIWIQIQICQLSPASDCQPAATTLTTITRASTGASSHSHTTPFSDVHPTLWTLLQVEGREPPQSSPAPCHHPSPPVPPPAAPTTSSPYLSSLHQPKSCAHAAARTDPEVSVARGHRTTVPGGNHGRNRQVLILSLSRRRFLCACRPISISGPAPLPQISGVSSACSRPGLCWRHCRWCLDPRRGTRAAKKLRLQRCLRLHLQLHLHLHLQLQPQLAAKHHRGRGRQLPHHGKAPSPLLESGDLTPQRLIRRQVTGTGAGTGRGTRTVPAVIHHHPPRPRAVKAVSAAPNPFQRLLTLRSEIIVDQLNSPP